jgi:hypothetical protein
MRDTYTRVQCEAVTKVTQDITQATPATPKRYRYCVAALPFLTPNVAVLVQPLEFTAEGRQTGPVQLSSAPRLN